MKKRELTEADIRTKVIPAALAGPYGGKWNLMTQVREEVWGKPKPVTAHYRLKKVWHAARRVHRPQPHAHGRQS